MERELWEPTDASCALDGLDDQIELVGAIDLAGFAVIAVRRDLLRFGEVVEPIHLARRVISHDKHNEGRHSVRGIRAR